MATTAQITRFLIAALNTHAHITHGRAELEDSKSELTELRQFIRYMFHDCTAVVMFITMHIHCEFL